MRRVRLGVANTELPDNTVSNTKYTRWNFLFKTLAQQFSKPMNRYFLLIAFLQLDSSLTPVNPASTWGPLMAVTLISMLKEHLDDRKRAQSDRIANERLYSVVGPGFRIQKARAASIRVGQLVHVLCDEEVPCDLVLLRTSEERLGAGTCYVQTTNLDGEADLKLRRALSTTQAVPSVDLHRLRGTIECSPPDADIHSFESTLVLDGKAGEAQRFGLGPEQLLLQATHVRKTEWVLGVAVYTGNQSKVGCNKQEPPFKYPAAEQLVNRFSVAIFCFQLVLTLALGLAGARWRAEVGAQLPYLAYAVSSRAPSVYYLVVPLRFLLLMSLMIPISLAVSLDILRWTYARWVVSDALLYDSRSGTGATVNSSAVPEDLGQIRYVFTDKTGTLTENEMNFSRASINGIAYGDGPGAPSGIFSDAALLEHTQAGQVPVINFWRCIALCNACSPSRSPARAQSEGEAVYSYASSSADEEALCLAAQSFGVSLALRSADGAIELELRAPRVGSSPVKRGSAGLLCGPLGGPVSTERWTVLHELPFSSERKRMSIVARHEGSGQIAVFTKGADDVMLPLLARRHAQVTARTARHIRRFARLGLRTLLLAMRSLEPREYENWARSLHEASVSSQGRVSLLAAVFGAIELELEPLGASAIEDKLQAGVPETIKALRDAHVRVWVLTGDKSETALEVARACRLVPHGAFVVDLRPSSLSIDSSGSGLLQSPGSPFSGAEPAGPWASVASGLRACVGGGGGQQPADATREPSALSVDSAEEDEPIPVLVLQGTTPAQLLQCIRQHRADLLRGHYGAYAASASAAATDRGEGGGSQPGESEDASYAIMLEGDVLSRALESGCRQDFYELALGAGAVICARATPVQKAQVVQLVKQATALLPGPAVRLLAVGDGGNDVAMIQEAHVGVGIAGKEGMQACRAADYTIGRFRFLQRLLLVHGRRAHRRTSAICLYTFYKSLFFGSVQVLFNCSTGFSGASFFPSLAVTVWNAPFTMVTGFSLLLDRDVSDRTLLSFPRLYAETQSSLDLNVRVFAVCWLRAVLQACFCYWATVSAFGTVHYQHPVSGASCELELTGYAGYTVALYVQVLTIYTEHNTFVRANHLALVGCLLVFHLSFWLYSSLALSADTQGLISYLYSDPAYWLGCATIACAAVLPVALLKFAVHHTWPREVEVVQFYARMYAGSSAGVGHQRPRMASLDEAASDSEDQRHRVGDAF